MMDSLTKKANVLRKMVVSDGKYLLANLDDSEQAKDVKQTRGSVNYVINKFFRGKTNIKPNEWSAPLFDMNWWAQYALGKGEPEDYNEVFIYQIKGCNMACEFCFVDDYNNNGRQDHNAKYKNMRFILDNFLKERERTRKEEDYTFNVFRASGGEPTLALEQWLEALRGLDEKGLSKEVYMHSDTNLTTGRAIDYWIKKRELPSDLLEKIAEFKNFGLLACFKSGLLDSQIYSLEKFVNAGIDVYPYFINPNPAKLEEFMFKLEKIFGEEILLKSHILKVKVYHPTIERLKKQAEKRGLDSDKFIERKITQWNRNTEQSEEIMNKILAGRFGLSYKKYPRPGLKLKIIKKGVMK